MTGKYVGKRTKPEGPAPTTRAVSYTGKPLQEMTQIELLEVLNEVADRLQEKYEEERQRLSDEAYVDYLLGVRYVHQFGGLYKRTLKT